MSNMKAELICKRRILFGEGRLAEIVIWRIPQPVPGSVHAFKYRFAYVVNGVCVLRYDNESGKGDHRHLGERELPYAFSTSERLVDDFLAEIARWNDEHGYL